MVVGGGESFKERLITVLKKTAFLANLIPHPTTLTAFFIVDEKLSNPINATCAGKVWVSLPGWAVGKSECSMLIALLSCSDPLFPCPQSLCYANQTTGVLKHVNHIISLSGMN